MGGTSKVARIDSVRSRPHQISTNNSHITWPHTWGNATARLQPLRRFLEAPTVLYGETLNQSHQEEPFQSRKHMANKIKGGIGNEYPIILTHFDTIFGPANKVAIETEEHNAEIWAASENDYCLPQEPELIHSLGKYSLVQPSGTALYLDIAALIDVYSKDRCPQTVGNIGKWNTQSNSYYKDHTP